MKNNTMAGTAGRIAGQVWLMLQLIDWREVARIVGHGLLALAVLTFELGMALGRGVHRLNDALARVAVRLMVPGAEPAPATPVAVAEPVAQSSAEPRVSAAAHPLTQLATAAADQLEAMTVPQLRRLARLQGLPRALSRTGRRAQLLEILSGLEVQLA